MNRQTELTLLLQSAGPGDPRAANQLLPLIYDELRAMAQHQLAREAPGHTLQATALVNEAYLRLVDQTKARYQDRHHFFAVAATAMRRILVDHARGKGRVKRGGDQNRVPLEAADGLFAAEDLDIEAIDVALAKLETTDPRKAKLVELRFFCGLSIEQAAAAMELSPATAKREWVLAKGYLHQFLNHGDDAHE